MLQAPAKFRINDFNLYKQSGRKIVMITAYDFHSAQILSEAAVDIILVGDSLGMVVQGHANTLSVSLDDILYHTKAVRRGAPDSYIVSDMPYLSYHTDINTTINNAGRLISQGQADAVKLEINHPKTLEHIAALVAAQIPVIAHIGMTPQSFNLFGGFKLQGKSQTQAQHISSLAAAAEEHGATAIVIECVPSPLAQQITAQLTIATIGIGAGQACNGQVLVFHDLLGLNATAPKFVKQYLNGRELFTQAISSFIQEVQKAEFPEAQHSFK